MCDRYMVGPLVADRIRDWFPHVRLIAMVRDPVERLFSEYVCVCVCVCVCHEPTHNHCPPQHHWHVLMDRCVAWCEPYIWRTHVLPSFMV